MATMTIETEVAHEAFLLACNALWANARDDYIGPGLADDAGPRAAALGRVIDATGGEGGAFVYPLVCALPDELIAIARDVIEGMEDSEPDLIPGCVRIGDVDESIYEYFERKLGRGMPIDATLYDLPVSSGCGADCKAAIDAAAALMRCSQKAVGDKQDELIRQVAHHTVEVFWRG